MSATLQKRGRQQRRGSGKPKKKIAALAKDSKSSSGIIKKKRHSNRIRMRINIQAAQRETTPALKKKASGTILRIARAYMTDYREDPKISRDAAEVLIHDLNAYIYNVVKESYLRAGVNAAPGAMPTLGLKHISAVMKGDNFRRSQQACYIPPSPAPSSE